MKIETADFVKSAFEAKDFLRDGRGQIAFAGRSNVGKSSVLNRLLERKSLARIGGTPGRTRAINYFLINRRFYFVDLPGYGYARAARNERQQWARMVDVYLQHALPNLHVILLVDAKVGATELDVSALDYLSELGARLTVVPTKIDRVSKNRRCKGLASIRHTLSLSERHEVVPISAHSGEGIKKLWREIARALESLAG